MHTEHRVFGPPGTGKTTYLSRNIRGAVIKYGPQKVLVTSFTKAAAVEIGNRLCKDGIKPHSRQIGTLHSLCYELLGNPPIADLAVPMAQWNELQPELQQSAIKSNRDDSHSDQDDPYSDQDDPAGDDLRSRCEIYRAQIINEEFWPNAVQDFYKKWCDFKADIDAIDFTDMVEKVYREKLSAPGQPKVIFADETQDYSRLELELIRFWASDPTVDHVVVAGDDDQAIYGFKGSTPDAFLNPPIPENQKHVLNQSYRLPRKIKELSDDWIKSVGRREVKKFSPRDEEGSIEHTKNDQIVSTIQNELNNGNKSVMVLASCSYMLSPIIDTLRYNGIPFHNPYRMKNGAWNPTRGGVQRLLEFLRIDPFSQSSWTWKSLWRWLEVIDCKESGLVHGRKSYVKNMANLEGEKDREVPFQDVVKLFGRETPPWEGRELSWFKAVVMTSKKALMSFSLRIAEKGGIKRLEEKPKIVIGTIHSVKGGEADTVVLLPDLSSSGLEEYSSGGSGKDGVTRMFYVGMTRARNKLVLCDAMDPGCAVDIGHKEERPVLMDPPSI